MARELSQISCRAFTLKPDNPRALDAHAYADSFIDAGVSAEGFDSVFDAVSAAYSAAKRDRVPLIALGSLYMYSEIKGAYLKIKEREEKTRG